MHNIHFPGVSISSEVRRCFLSLLPRAAWLAAFFCCTAISSSAKPPTIVVFVADDHGLADSTPYGSKDARTPNMQRVAGAGMTFTHAFVASPSCAPSRSAMLTGLMPARNGAEANHTFKRDDVASLPEVLRTAGYETAAFGKIAHGKKDASRHGFDHIDEKSDAGEVDKYLSGRDAKKPLALFVGTHWPHVPWPENDGFDPAKITLPPKAADTPETRVQRARYLSAVARADDDLGSIWDLAHKRFDASNMLFLYTADHGEQWPFGKWNLYDTGIRVPFLAVWPGVIRPGSRSDAMIQWIDILPTLIEVAGGSVPKGIDGRSFISVLRGTTNEHRTEIFTTHSGDGDKNVYPIRALRTGGFKYIRNLLPAKSHTTHIDRGGGSGDGWRYFDEWVTLGRTDARAAAQVRAYHQRPAEELYDLRTDPDEEHNLALDTAQSARLADLRARLETWMREQGDRKSVFETPHEVGEPYPERNAMEPPAGRKKNRTKE